MGILLNLFPVGQCPLFDVRILRCFIVTISLATTSFPSEAQAQVEIDSLLKLLHVLKDDSIKVMAYDRLAYYYNFSQNKTELARKYIDSVQLLSERLNYEEGIILSHYSYGFIDLNEDRYSDALNHFKTYINFYTKRGDSLKVARALYGVGIVYKELDDYDKHLAVQLRALKLFEEAGNLSSAANTLNSIGTLYRRTNNYRDAIKTYKRAIKILKDLNNNHRYGLSLHNLANVYVSMKDYDSAKLIYMEALKAIREHGSEDDLAYALGDIGDLYEEINDYDKALSYNLQALEIRRRLSSKRGLASSLIGVGHMYVIMDQYDKAEKYLKEGIAMAQDIGSKHLLQEGYADLSVMHAAKGDFRKAYDFNIRTNQWKDSIYNDNTSQQVNTLKTRYETSEKDKQITILAKEKEVQEIEIQRQSTIKKTFIAGFILVVVMAVLAVYTFRQRLLLMKTNNEIKEVNLKHQLSELEMKALRAQINPHFLFNCLNSINRMIVKGENENASLYLKKFSKLVRLIVENVETTRVSLKNELALIEAYIQLEELRFKGKIGFEISIDEKIEKENTFLPPMVLQPFVENAIWHGLMHKESDEQGQIKIAVKENHDVLVCTIEDNGVGRVRSEELKDKDPVKTRSIGIKVTEERLKLLSKERVKELIRIVDLRDTFNTATGTRVEISIPLS